MPALVLLQAGQWTPTVSSEGSITFLIVVVVLITLFVLYGMRAGSSSAKTISSGFSLRKQARLHGLTPDHYRILKHAIKDLKIQTPSVLFTNGRFLNTTLRQLIDQIDNSSYSDATKETLKSELYDIKARITHENPALKTPVSTKSMLMNQEVTLYSKTFPPFRTELIGKTAEVIAFELPRDSQGEWIQYKIGSPIKVRYIRDEDKVFSFVSTVKDIREIEGSIQLLLPHSAEVKRVQLRKSPRKEFHRTTFFYKVDVMTEGKGRKEVRKAVVNKTRRFSGTLEDISAGGCSLFTRTPLQVGNLIMLTFDISKGMPINVFGKVRNVRRDKSGTLMHLMFTRVSTKHLNEIRSFIYGFSEEDEQPRNQYLI